MTGLNGIEPVLQGGHALNAGLRIEHDPESRHPLHHPADTSYKFEIMPGEAAVVLRVFHAYAQGLSVIRIVRMLNTEAVPGRIRTSKGWSPATVSRLLENEKYIGRWVWNKHEARRDPRTGRRRQFPKPESEWITHEDASLRIVPQDLWEVVRNRRQQVRRS